MTYISWQLWLFMSHGWVLSGFFSSKEEALTAYDNYCRDCKLPEDSKIVKVEHL